MAKLTPCPKCHRKTWSTKWKSCTACGYREGEATAEGALATPAPEKKKAKAPFAKRYISVTKDGNGRDGSVTTLVEADDGTGPRYASVTPEPGSECPTCGQRVPYPSAAERQKAYRGRKRGNGNP